MCLDEAKKREHSSIVSVSSASSGVLSIALIVYG